MQCYVGKIIDSPVGLLTLVASERGLAAILWQNDAHRRRTGRRVPLSDVVESDTHPILLETERQLREYFAGRRRQFALPLDLKGTEFQRRVWSALLTIPYGETRSYAQIARLIGCPEER